MIIGFQGILGRDGPPEKLSDLPSGATFGAYTTNLIHLEEALSVLIEMLQNGRNLSFEQYWVYDRRGPAILGKDGQSGHELWYRFLGRG